MLQTDTDFIAARIPPLFFDFSRVFRDAGFQAVLVGGAIRDIVRGYVPGDFDFASDARPEEVMHLFPSVIPTGIQHGTVTVRFHKQSIEVTTFRIEGTYSDQRHPDVVSFSKSLDDDLQRRDFTMNALAVQLPECRIIDTTGGLRDIRNACIRAIGTPHERFNEDALRIWRGLRFASRLGFRIEPHTLKAMHDTAAGVQSVAAERIREEWIKLLQGTGFGAAVIHAQGFGILPSVLPFQAVPAPLLAEICGRLEDGRIPAVEWRWRYACLLTADCREAGSGSGIEADTAAVAGYLQDKRYSREDVSEILHRMRAIHTPLPGESSVRRYLYRLQRADHHMVNQARHALDMSVMDPELLERLDSELDRGIVYGPADLAVNGHNLSAALETAPGAWIGILLSQLVDLCVEHPEMNTPEQLLQHAVRLQHNSD